jgi:excisionase family DNA binding protein
MPLPLPPPPQQRAIAMALSDVDGLMRGLDRLIAKKRDLKQAAMQQLLTGQTRLPGFHGEWAVKRLGDAAQLIPQNVIPASHPTQMFVHFSLPSFDAGKTPVVELGSAIGSNKFQVPQGAVGRFAKDKFRWCSACRRFRLRRSRLPRAIFAATTRHFLDRPTQESSADSRKLMKTAENADTTIYLDKKQTARLLQITDRTLSYWMQKRMIPYVRIGRTVRFRRSDLENSVGAFFPARTR